MILTCKVSIQLISLASRDTPLNKGKAHASIFFVSIQLISLASRDLAIGIR